MTNWKIVEAGFRSALKTTGGGLLVADKKTKRVLKFDITSDDLYSLANSLRKRELDEISRKSKSSS